MHQFVRQDKFPLLQFQEILRLRTFRELTFRPAKKAFLPFSYVQNTLLLEFLRRLRSQGQELLLIESHLAQAIKPTYLQSCCLLVSYILEVETRESF